MRPLLPLWAMCTIGMLAGAGGKVSHRTRFSFRDPHPDGPVRGVVLIAIGRTGSTLLSHLFAAVPGAFVIVEPYKPYLSIDHSDVPARQKLSPGQMPTMASLLDCSFASSPEVFNQMRWDFLCMHSRLVPKEHLWQFKQRCLSDTPLNDTDIKMVREFCLGSRLRVLKTIRFTHILGPARQSLISLARTPGYTVSALHVVRHPYEVLVSQYNLAWHSVLKLRTCNGSQECTWRDEPRELTPEQVRASGEHIGKLGPKICKLMTTSTEYMRDIASALNGTFVLRYEDIAPPLTAVSFTEIWNRLRLGDGVVADFDPGETATIVSNSHHAGFRITGQDRREAQTKAVTKAGLAQSLMAETDVCSSLYSDFNYGIWPPPKKKR
eukprot:m.6911 g.6911  ORF g.6911 m.6911 type:complete len:380 (-) comp3889_c0_seq2:260-1399(-)